MNVRCESCKSFHKINAAQMAVVLENLQKGLGQVVGLAKSRTGAYVTNVYPKCYLELTPERVAVKSRRV